MANRQQLERELRQQLALQGFAVELLDQWPARATYYKPDGESMLGLPSDPFSMKRYLARGFTLVPPPTPPEADDLFDEEPVKKTKKGV